MGPEDVYSLTGVSDPRLRPGGNEVAYVQWWIDPEEDLIGILMSQHLPSWMDMKVPDVIGDFWTSVYQAIDD